MQVYELSYLILPSIPEDGVNGVVEKIKALITKEGGTVFDEEAPIHMDLAYTMTKVVGASRYVVDDAYMGWLKFEAEPALAPALDKELVRAEEIVRHLIVKTTRETHFTFAKAKEKLAALEVASAPEAESVSVEEVPAEVVE